VAHQGRLSVPDAEQAGLCPGRNGHVPGIPARSTRFSAIAKIDCLRIGPNLMAGAAPFASRFAIAKTSY